MSIETTTGMSAPPIGMMMSTPTTRARAVTSQNAWYDSVWQNQTAMPTRTSPRTAFRWCWNAKTTGAPETRPWSFRKATIEPVKVMAPMATPMDISMRLAAAIRPGSPIPNACGA